MDVDKSDQHSSEKNIYNILSETSTRKIKINKISDISDKITNTKITNTKTIKAKSIKVKNVRTNSTKNFISQSNIKTFITKSKINKGNATKSDAKSNINDNKVGKPTTSTTSNLERLMKKMSINEIIANDVESSEVQLESPHFGVIPILIDFQQATQNFQKNIQNYDPQRLYILVTRFYLLKKNPKSENKSPVINAIEITPSPQNSMTDYDLQLYLEEKMNISDDQIYDFSSFQVHDNLTIYFAYLKKYIIPNPNPIQHKITYTYRSYIDIYGLKYTEHEENPYQAILDTNLSMDYIKYTSIQTYNPECLTTSFKLYHLYHDLTKRFFELKEKIEILNLKRI